MAKRVFDLVVAAPALIVLTPILLALTLIIKIGSPGPVFYRGVRAGFGGTPFRMLKFRSMVVNADRIGGPSTAGDDPRLTAIGKIMRRYKLDELPQLINVVAGDMSLVGPRPEVLSEVAEYTTEQRQVLTVRPGITDWASIWNSNEEAVLKGAADPHRAYKELIQPTKLALQLKYAQHHSFATDLRILLSTARKLVDKQWTPRALAQYAPAVADVRRRAS